MSQDEVRRGLSNRRRRRFQGMVNPTTLPLPSFLQVSVIGVGPRTSAILDAMAVEGSSEAPLFYVFDEGDSGCDFARAGLGSASGHSRWVGGVEDLVGGDPQLIPDVAFVLIDAPATEPSDAVLQFVDELRRYTWLTVGLVLDRATANRSDPAFLGLLQHLGSSILLDPTRYLSVTASSSFTPRRIAQLKVDMAKRAIETICTLCGCTDGGRLVNTKLCEVYSAMAVMPSATMTTQIIDRQEVQGVGAESILRRLSLGGIDSSRTLGWLALVSDSETRFPDYEMFQVVMSPLCEQMPGDAKCVCNGTWRSGASGDTRLTVIAGGDFGYV